MYDEYHDVMMSFNNINLLIFTNYCEFYYNLAFILIRKIKLSFYFLSNFYFNQLEIIHEYVQCFIIHMSSCSFLY